MKISVSYYTAAGKCDKNEDAVKIIRTENGVLALLADGLGGMMNGGAASELALDEIVSCIDLNAFSEEEITRAVRRANSAVREQRKNGVEMCTTVAALWIDDGKAIACHVGDSRIYQIRSGSLKYQSIDHSVSQLAVLMGEIKPSEIRGHIDRNKLIHAVGADDDIKLSIKILNVKEDDAFLLCSDGFWEKIVEEDMIKFRGSYLKPSEWLSDMQNYIADKVDDNNSAVAVFVN